METLFLFASDTGVGRDAMLVTLGGAVLAAIGKLFEFGWNWFSQSRADQKEEQGKIEGHLAKRVARLEADNERCAKRVGRILRRVRVLENSNTQMRVYIASNKTQNTPPYVEIPLPDELDESEDDAPGTDTHTPLKPNSED